MALTVADTDVLIDALRGREPARSRIEQLLLAGQLATTAITEFELLSGAGSDAARAAVGRLLAPLEVLALDTEAARQAAELRRELERDGTPIGMADYLIAGICRARSAAILTRNTAHFGRIHGLTLVPLE